MIRILIVDGQAQVRQGLHMRLSIEPDMVVIGETGDVEEAVSLARDLDPDVILVDIEMRGADEANMLKRLGEAAPAASTIALTLYGGESIRLRAEEAGAQAFLGKHGGGAGLLQAIRQGAAGQSQKSAGAKGGPVGKATAKR